MDARHRRLANAAALVLTVILAALTAALGASPAPARSAAGKTSPAATPSATSDLPLSPLATAPPLSLDMAAGQMMAASFGGPTITDGLRHLILDEKVGTVLIFGDNFSDAASLARLCSDLQALGRQAGLPAPLQVAVDEEGGRVMRVTDGVAPLASQLLEGAEGAPVVRRDVAATAAGLHRVGVQLDLAPVADLRTNPADTVIGDRSFGADPAVVGPLVAAEVAGLHDAGVAATLKHFPGLGGAAGDPHAAIPSDSESLDQWLATQARSFQAGIDAGADAVMTTALVAPGLDASGTPALFSPTIVTGLLRNRLHFQGVIVTDGLGMGGITALYDLPTATLAAVRAGNDLVLLNSADAAYQASAIEALKAQVRNGAIPMSQIQASASRVIAMRARWPAWAPSALEDAATPSFALAGDLSRR